MRAREYIRAVSLFAASRAWIAMVGAWSFENVAAGGTLPTPATPFSAVLTPRWDENYYLQIAASGYEPDCNHNAFFPAYPLLFALVARVFGILLFEAARLVSNIAAPLAFMLFVKLCRRDMTETETARAVTLLAFFPTGIYFSLVYTESLFLLLVVSALLAMRSRRWVLASILGYAAATCRANGFLLLVPLVVEYALARRRQGRSFFGLPLLAFALVPAGLVTFLLHLYAKTGDIHAHSHVEKSHWDRSISFVTVAIRHLFELPQPMSYRLLLLAYPLLALAAIVLGLRQRMRLAYVGYGTAMTGLALSIGYLDSTGRFLLVMPTMFMALGVALRNAFFYWLVLIAFVLLQAVTTVLYFRGYWIV